MHVVTGARMFGCVVVAMGCMVVGAPGAGAAVAVTVKAVPVSAIEDATFSAEVGTYSGSCPGPPATIDWGDQTGSVPATLAPLPTGGCAIIATHTYAEEGTYTTTVIVGTVASGAATGISTATVADAALKLTGTAVSGTAGVATSGTVAILNDTGGLEPAADYSAQIDWGDGHSSVGTITATGGGTASVSGTNSYATAGTYPIKVTVTDEGGQTATSTATASISQAAPPPCNATPLSAAAPFTPSPSTPDGRWIQAVYHDLLGRTADGVALNQLTAQMLAGASREVIVDYLEGDPDRPIVVGSLFNELLHRAASGSEVAYWAQFLAHGGSDEAVAANLLASAEYLNVRGGGTTTGFLGAMYCDLLHRGLAQSDLNYWQSQLAAGVTRMQAAQAVLASGEYRTVLVRSLYLRFLRRVPSGGEVAYWFGQLGSGVTDEQLSAGLLSSQEYFNMFSSGGTIGVPVISSLGVIHVTLAAPATLGLRVLQLLPAVQRGRADDAAVHVPAPKTRLLGTVSLGHHHPGRVTIRWHLKIKGRRVKAGRYLLILEARRGGKLTDVSDAIAVRLR